MTNRTLVLLPDQLFPVESLSLDGIDEVVVYEDPYAFGYDNPASFHVHKLVFMRASIRRYVADLEEKGMQVRLVSYDDALMDLATRQLYVERAQTSPDGFILTETEAHELYVRGTGVEGFFEAATAKIGYASARSTWSIPRTLPLKHMVPEVRMYGRNDQVRQAMRWVGQNFPDNPGELSTYMWPTHRTEALAWMRQFVEERLVHYETYEQSVDMHGVFVFHSGISVLLNSGLLVIRDVIQALSSRSDASRLVFNVCGEREYLRALSLESAPLLLSGRHRLSRWRAGSTGLEPLDGLLHKAHMYGYLTHSERLIVLAASHLLEMSHDDRYGLYMGLTTDAVGWAVEPWVNHSEKLLKGKLPIVTAKYVQSVGVTRRGNWSQLWDSLYWMYIDRHRTELMAHPTTLMMVRAFDRMDEARRAMYRERAELFLERLNSGIL